METTSNAEIAVEQLIERHTRDLLRLVTAVLHSPEDAKDVCQDVFFRYFERASTIDNPRAWLYRATLNRSINLKRQRAGHRAKRPELIALSQPAADPTAEIEIREQRRMLRDAIAELPEGQRSALILRQRLELPIKDIAALLNVTDGTVKKQLSRAVTALCTRFADRGKPRS